MQKVSEIPSFTTVKRMSYTVVLPNGGSQTVSHVFNCKLAQWAAGLGKTYQTGRQQHRAMDAQVHNRRRVSNIRTRAKLTVHRRHSLRRSRLRTLSPSPNSLAVPNVP